LNLSGQNRLEFDNNLFN